MTEFEKGDRVRMCVDVDESANGWRIAKGAMGTVVAPPASYECVLVLFYTFEVLPGLVLIPFGLFAMAILVWGKSRAPVD